MVQVLRAGGPPPTPKEVSPVNIIDEQIIVDVKREYGVISAFFQSMMMNMTNLDKNIEYVRQYKDVERDLIMTLTIMVIRQLKFDKNEFAVLHNTISQTPISNELLNILFEAPLNEDIPNV